MAADVNLGPPTRHPGSDEIHNSGGLSYWLNTRHFETTDDAFIDAHTATVSSQVPGLKCYQRARLNPGRTMTGKRRCDDVRAAVLAPMGRGLDR